MPTMMCTGKRAKREFKTARDAILAPVLEGFTYSFGKTESMPPEMSEPAWSRYAGYGAYELLYGEEHGRVSAPAGVDDERDEKLGETDIPLVAGRLFGTGITIPFSEKSVEAINKCVTSQADSLANLMPMPEELANDCMGLAAALPDIWYHYLYGTEPDPESGEEPREFSEDTVKWLNSFGSGREGWDAFCHENVLPDCGYDLATMTQESLLFAWQSRADAISRRIGELVLDVRERYVKDGRTEGEYEPFTAITDLVVTDGSWCRIGLFDALVESVDADDAVTVMLSAPNEFAQMSDEYGDLVAHGMDVDLAFDDAGELDITVLNERIEDAKDGDWRFDIEYVREDGGFWHWRFAGETGDLTTVVGEYTRTGLLFPYRDEFEHSHSFNEVLQEIWRDPEGFTVDDEQKTSYSEQELAMMDAFRDKLLARKGGEPDNCVFPWQISERFRKDESKGASEKGAESDEKEE